MFISMTLNPTLQTSRKVSGKVQVAVAADDKGRREILLRAVADDASVDVTDIGHSEVLLWEPGSGDVASKLHRLSHMDVPVVVVLDTAEFAPVAKSYGARGIVLRKHLEASAAAALHAVAHGLNVLDPELANLNSASGVTHAVPHLDVPGVSLTERERQVVALLAEGLSNKLIAEKLGISDHTAKFHVTGVMAKLSATSRTEAVVEAVRRGLVTL